MKDDHGTWTTMTIIAFTMCQEGPPWGLNDKESACQAGDEGLIPASGRSPGEGNGNPLRYSCLGNPMDRGAWWGYSPWGHKRVGHDIATKRQQRCSIVCAQHGLSIWVVSSLVWWRIMLSQICTYKLLCNCSFYFTSANT